MTSKERVLSALNHRLPDRIPTDLGTTNCTSIAKKTYEKLKAHYGVTGDDALLFEPFQIMQCDESILQALQIDTRALPGNYSAYEQKRWIDANTYVDRFGITYKMAGNGLYFDFCGYPLSQYESVEEIRDKYEWPDPIVPEETAGLAQKAKELHEQNQYALVGDIVNSGIWERSQNMRGFENFLIDIKINTEIAHYVLENMTEHCKKRMGAYLDAVGEYLDVVFVGDDLATGLSTVMSLETFREMVKPYLKEYWGFIKKRAPKAKLMVHSCGAIMPFIDDMIEIGMDILNPIQVNAKGMDTRVLKERYGERLVFWGAIDAHNVMPHGDAARVKQEVEKRVRDLGPSGYVLCENHNIQADIPVENVITMYQHAKKIELT